jgi:hypothetical protein
MTKSRESRLSWVIRRISRLPTLPNGSGEGGLEMTQANQIQKSSDDFKVAIVIRIEGRNSRAIILRFAGIAAALIAVGAKVATMLLERAP